MSTRRISGWMAVAAAVCSMLLGMPGAARAATQPDSSRNAIPRERLCDRACLYAVLDQYLARLVDDALGKPGDFRDLQRPQALEHLEPQQGRRHRIDRHFKPPPPEPFVRRCSADSGKSGKHG